MTYFRIVMPFYVIGGASFPKTGIHFSGSCCPQRRKCQGEAQYDPEDSIRGACRDRGRSPHHIRGLVGLELLGSLPAGS